jgi:hypothetical protein
VRNSWGQGTLAAQRNPAYLRAALQLGAVLALRRRRLLRRGRRLSGVAKGGGGVGGRQEAVPTHGVEIDELDLGEVTEHADRAVRSLLREHHPQEIHRPVASQAGCQHSQARGGRGAPRRATPAPVEPGAGWT